MRIPYPIPEPERSALIAAGERAVMLSTNPDNATAHREAQAEVRKIIADIQFLHGIDEDEQP